MTSSFSLAVTGAGKATGGGGTTEAAAASTMITSSSATCHGGTTGKATADGEVTDTMVGGETGRLTRR